MSFTLLWRFTSWIKELWGWTTDTLLIDSVIMRLMKDLYLPWSLLKNFKSGYSALTYCVITHGSDMLQPNSSDFRLQDSKVSHNKSNSRLGMIKLSQILNEWVKMIYSLHFWIICEKIIPRDKIKFYSVCVQLPAAPFHLQLPVPRAVMYLGQPAAFPSCVMTACCVSLRFSVGSDFVLR